MRLAGNRAQHAVFAAGRPRCQCPACKSQTGKKLFPSSMHAQSNLFIIASVKALSGTKHPVCIELLPCYNHLYNHTYTCPKYQGCDYNRSVCMCHQVHLAVTPIRAEDGTTAH